MKIKKLLAMMFVVVMILGGTANLVAAAIPGANHNVITINQGTSHTFSVANFGFTHPATPAHTFQSVRISAFGLPASSGSETPWRGIVTVNGVDVSTGAETATINVADIASGFVNFVPATGETGMPYTAFYFQNIDSNGDMTNNYIMRINVNAVSVNTAPVATNDSATAQTAIATDINVLANDSDADAGDVLRISAVSTPTSGTATIEGTNVRYTSNSGFVGTDSFTYTVSDGTATDTATVTITVSAVGTGEATLTISPNPVLFNNVNRGTRTVPVTLTSSGASGGVTVTNVEFVGVDAKYQATVNALALPIDLGVGTSETFDVQLNIPLNEDSGKNNIGSIRVSWMRGTESFQETVPLEINPKSELEIKNFDINGKSSGKLSVEEENEIEIEVKNNFNEDIDDVEVTVTILDVDGDDLDEDETVDIRDGDEETLTFTFDLTNEDIDEDSYDIEVKVEGVDDNGAKHTTVERKTVDVDREKHKVVIRKVSLDRSSVSCTAQSGSISVKIENIGEKDEDDVEIRISNPDLNLDIRKSNIDLDDFKGRDNDHEVNVPFDLTEATNGEHQIKVEVYLDGSLEDREEVTLTVNCGARTTGGLNTNDNLIEEIRQGLDARETAREQGKSIRGSSSYLVLLGILAVLVFVAVVLALAVMLTKKK
jgi:hypothetical protein